jgi:hypothetical protein
MNESMTKTAHTDLAGAIGVVERMRERLTFLKGEGSAMDAVVRKENTTP